MNKKDIIVSLVGFVAILCFFSMVAVDKLFRYELNQLEQMKRMEMQLVVLGHSK